MLNLDTHVLLHALSDELTAKERALLSKRQWSISGIVLWEIYKLEQLGRIEIDMKELEQQLRTTGVHIWPIDLHVLQALTKLDFKNDPADGLIAATSLAFNVPLLTRDKKIKKSRIVPLA